MACLSELFKRYRGQPVEVIMEGLKVVGIVCESDGYGVTLIDRCGRLVHIENNQIQVLIEPQMHLKRLFGDEDLGCDCDSDCDRRHKHRGDRDCDHDHCDRDCDDDGVAII